MTHDTDTDLADDECPPALGPQERPPAVVLRWPSIDQSDGPLATLLAAADARLVALGLTNGGWTAYAAARLPCGCVVHGYCHVSETSAEAIAASLRMTIEAHDGRMTAQATEDVVDGVDAADEIEEEIAETPEEREAREQVARLARARAIH